MLLNSASQHRLTSSTHPYAHACAMCAPVACGRRPAPAVVVAHVLVDVIDVRIAKLALGAVDRVQALAPRLPHVYQIARPYDDLHKQTSLKRLSLRLS